MKVLMTADTVGGVWTYSLQLARSLAEQGVRVALGTLGAPIADHQREEAEQVPLLELHESDFKLEWMEDPWADVHQAGDWLLSIEAEVRPDVIHLNGYAHGSLPWNAPAIVVGHSCVVSWWEAVKGEAPPPSWDRYRYEVRRGLQAADMVVAPSRAMLHALERHYGPLRESSVIYNAVDPALFSPGEKRKLILTAGRIWDEAKNVAALERVAPDLPWPVYVAGEDTHPEGGSATLSNLHLLGKLPRPQLARRLAEAAIYCLPARYEPFGLSALEAGLAGCALVLGDIPSLREIWGDAAIFVPPGDHNALSSALQLLISDEDKRLQMAQRARTRAQQFTPRRMATAYLSTYRDLMAAKAQQLTTIKLGPEIASASAM